MSTNTPEPTESQTTTATQSTPASVSSADAASAERTPDADTAESWVARCRRQFDARRTDRLRNLADEANEAMP